MGEPSTCTHTTCPVNRSDKAMCLCISVHVHGVLISLDWFQFVVERLLIATNWWEQTNERINSIQLMMALGTASKRANWNYECHVIASCRPNTIFATNFHESIQPYRHFQWCNVKRQKNFKSERINRVAKCRRKSCLKVNHWMLILIAARLARFWLFERIFDWIFAGRNQSTCIDNEGCIPLFLVRFYK